MRALAWTSAIVGVVTLGVFAAMVALGWSSAGAQALVAAFGLLATATTVVANVAEVQSRPAGGRPVAPRRGAQLGEAPFVDRDAEITRLAVLLEGNRVVACHGAQGTGKSYLLQYVVDVANGHRPVRAGHGSDPRLPSAGLYFDLADSTGWDKVERQICEAAFGAGDVATWTGFCRAVDDIYGDDDVLLVLDNVNASSLWPAIGRAVYAYLNVRPRDRIVLGSIEAVVLDNMTMTRLEVPAFDAVAIGEYAAAHGYVLAADRVEALRETTLGLPLYLGIVLAEPAERSHRKVAASSALEHSLRSELSPATRRALSYLALLSLVERRIPARSLARLPIVDIDAQLDLAASRSLVAIGSDDGVRSVRVHDIVRDSALHVLEDEVRSAASVLVEWATRHDDEVQACIFALHCDPATFGEERLWPLVDSVVRSAVERRDLALLETIHGCLTRSEAATAFVWSDRGRSDLLSYSRASQLAGVGRYRDAEGELLESSVVAIRPGTLDQLDELQADLYYLLADVVHLQNRYDESAAMFRDLAELAIARGDALMESRCLRSVAHVLRHQGRDLDTALALFADARDAAVRAGDLRARVLATTGPIGIRVHTGVVSDDDRAVLAALDAELAATEDLQSLRFSVWKYQAHVAWALGNADDAAAFLDAAISEALRLNDRMLFNLYFDRADFARLLGRQADAVADYSTVLDFGLANGDRNLIANARLGLVMCDLDGPGWAMFGSVDAALAEALRARETATEADIQATVQAATAVANAVVSEDRTLRLRFILF